MKKEKFTAKDAEGRKVFGMVFGDLIAPRVQSIITFILVMEQISRMSFSEWFEAMELLWDFFSQPAYKKA